jgi:hypothetical protein
MSVDKTVRRIFAPKEEEVKGKRRKNCVLKNAVFWDVAPCRYFVNRRFGGTYRLHLQGIRNPRVMNQREQMAVAVATCSRWFIARGFLIP